MKEEFLVLMKKYLKDKEIGSQLKDTRKTREKIVGLLNSSHNPLLENIVLLESMSQDYFDILLQHLATTGKAKDLLYYALYLREEINEKALLKTQLAKIIEEVIEEKVIGIKVEPVHTISCNLSKRFDILAKSGFKCIYCGRKAPEVELELEHIIPKAKGGTDDIKNLAVACRECNLGKSDKLIKRDDEKKN